MINLRPDRDLEILRNQWRTCTRIKYILENQTKKNMTILDGGPLVPVLYKRAGIESLHYDLSSTLSYIFICSNNDIMRVYTVPKRLTTSEK